MNRPGLLKLALFAGTCTLASALAVAPEAALAFVTNGYDPQAAVQAVIDEELASTAAVVTLALLGVGWLSHHARAL